MNSLTNLLLSVLEESGARCGVNTMQDRKTILHRVEHQGVSFLTITLPDFGKDLQKALSDRKVSSDHFVGFKRRRGEVLPEFLGGFLSLVFDPSSGGIIHDGWDLADRSENALVGDAVRAILQVTGMMAKVELQCTPEREKAALQRYVDNERVVREKDATRTEEQYLKFIAASHKLFGSVLNDVQKDIKSGNIRMAHGPGSTADKLLGNEKWNPELVSSWHDRLESVFPFGRYALPSWSSYVELLESGKLHPGTEMPVKVILVPKTLKTPRVIAMEPTAVQYAQQGIRRSLEGAIKRHRVSRLLIDYSSQEPNQQLAKAGSKFIPSSKDDDGWTTTYATLDLSDASDLVSNQLVRALCRDFPELGEAIDATRSRTADVDGHGVIRLAKYASMGSALCFPIEAMVFAIVSFIGIKSLYPSETWESVINRFTGKVRVYGDDIIVPTYTARAVADSLEAYGLKVNHHKSFWTGMFRESCGKEYYNGTDVTIVKCRYLLPSRQLSSRERTESIVRTVALRNHLYHYGYWRSVRMLDEILSGEMKHFPATGPDSPALGRHSYLGYQTDGWDSDLQRPKVKALVVTADLPRSNLDGWGALQKFFSKNSDLPNPDENHLEKAGRPLALRIKPRWVSPF